MAGYILEFKDDMDKQELLDKVCEVKEIICDICEMLEDADMDGEEPMEEPMSERNRMRRRDGMSNRGGRMRDERMMRGEGMAYRRGRNGRYY